MNQTALKLVLRFSLRMRAKIVVTFENMHLQLKERSQVHVHYIIEKRGHRPWNCGSPFTIQHNEDKGRIADMLPFAAANGFVRWLIGLTRASRLPNGISIGSAVLHRKRQIHKRQIDTPRYMRHLQQ